MGLTEEVVIGGRSVAAREGELSRGEPMKSCCHSLLISRAPTDAKGALARRSGERARVTAGDSDLRGPSMRSGGGGGVAAFFEELDNK